MVKESKGSEFVNGVVKKEPDKTFEGNEGGEVKRLETLIKEQKICLRKCKKKGCDRCKI